MQKYVNQFVEEDLISSILEEKKLNENEKKSFMTDVSIFSYGSSVYKNKPAADYDYIVVSPYKLEQFEDVFCIRGKTVSIQITFYTVESFYDMLKNAEISALECMYLDQKKEKNSEDNILAFVDKKMLDCFKDMDVLNNKLRVSISKKSSNSYVKAKKKIIIENDFDLKTSLKSLWHSFRMVGFALQVAMPNSNNIDYFDIANDLYAEIVEDYLDYSSYKSNEDFWKFIHSKYQPRHNALMSVFREYALKEGFSSKEPLNKEELYNIVNKGYVIDPILNFQEKV